MVAPTYNEELFDAMLRHQIGLQRFSGSLRNQVWELLDATEKDLKRQVRRAGRIGLERPAEVARLNKLLAGLRKTRLGAWREVNAKWFEEIRALALAEPGFVNSIFTASAPGVELGAVLPEAEALRKIVQSKPFMGKTLGQWSKSIQADDIARIEGQVKIGLTQGETLPQISRRIVGSAELAGRNGVTQITRRGAAAITRTVVSGVTSESRRLYAIANEDLAPFERFTATLDGRTTPICRRWDGTRHRVEEGPRLPLHMGERSLRIPELDGEVIGERPRRDFTQQQLVREYGRKAGIDVRVPRGATSKAARAAIPRGHRGGFDKFSRGRMRELTGTTPAKTTYQQFLRRQSAANQNDILGPNRGALFRKGGLTLDKFVEVNGRELTLAQLASRHSSAFLRAGLDPSAFK